MQRLMFHAVKLDSSFAARGEIISSLKVQTARRSKKLNQRRTRDGGRLFWAQNQIQPESFRTANVKKTQKTGEAAVNLKAVNADGLTVIKAKT